MMTTCAVCSTPPTLRCLRCYETYYCGKEHQRADWKTHKKHVAFPTKFQKIQQ